MTITTDRRCSICGDCGYIADVGGRPEPAPCPECGRTFRPLPQSIDRDPPTDAQVFAARVVVFCIAAFVVGLVLFAIIQDFGRVTPGTAEAGGK